MPRGYPNQIIWESPFLSGGTIADLDRDGQKEIIGADNNNDRLLVFEYDPTINAHVEKAVLVNETSGSNVFAQTFAIADFDADGRTELVAGDSEGEIFLYESTTIGNTFRLGMANASSRSRTSPNSLLAISLEMAHLNLWWVDSYLYQSFPRQDRLSGNSLFLRIHRMATPCYRTAHP